MDASHGEIINDRKHDSGGFMKKMKSVDGPSDVKSFYQENRSSERTNTDGDFPGTLTTSGAVFGILSTILGGGIVGIPFSFYSLGLIIGIFVAVFASV